MQMRYGLPRASIHMCTYTHFSSSIHTVCTCTEYINLSLRISSHTMRHIKLVGHVSNSTPTNQPLQYLQCNAKALCLHIQYLVKPMAACYMHTSHKQREKHSLIILYPCYKISMDMLALAYYH